MGDDSIDGGEAHDGQMFVMLPGLQDVWKRGPPVQTVQRAPLLPTPAPPRNFPDGSPVK